MCPSEEAAPPLRGSDLQGPFGAEPPCVWPRGPQGMPSEPPRQALAPLHAGGAACSRLGSTPHLRGAGWLPPQPWRVTIPVLPRAVAIAPGLQRDPEFKATTENAISRAPGPGHPHLEPSIS